MKRNPDYRDDGRRQQRHGGTMLAIMANVPLIGPNMLVAADALLEDGLLDISLYPNFSKRGALAYFAKVMDERSTEDGKIQRYRARKLKIKASPKLEVLADGILLGKGTVRIKVLPGALRVIAPEVGRGAKPPSDRRGFARPVAPVVVDVDSRKNGAVKVCHVA
jgi:diacylglycerol kinase family enzyme